MSVLEETTAHKGWKRLPYNRAAHNELLGVDQLVESFPRAHFPALRGQLLCEGPDLNDQGVTYIDGSAAAEGRVLK